LSGYGYTLRLYRDTRYWRKSKRFSSIVDFFSSQAVMAASEYHQKFEEIPKFVSSSLVLTLRCRFTSGVCMSANGKCGIGGLLSQHVKA